jgi:cupredoxin-like protein
MNKSCSILVALSFGLLSVTSHAEDYVITIKNSQFSPTELFVPAGKKVKITVKNQDAIPAEFESSDLNREKIITAHSEIFIFIGPLDAGSYGFFNDFHPESRGSIVAK